jgi:tetratricopeptide (TPR) repeat protein
MSDNFEKLLINNSDYQQGLAIFDQLGLEPNCVNIRHSMLGNRSGPKIQMAIDFFTKALEKDPTNPIIWVKKGIAHMRNIDYDDATTCFDNLINMDYNPDLMLIYKGAMLLSQSERNEPEARKYYEKALELNPNNFTAHLELAKFFSQYPVCDYVNGIIALERILSKPELPKDSICYSQILYRIGFCYMEMKNQKKANEYFDKALNCPNIYPHTRGLCIDFKNNQYPEIDKRRDDVKKDNIFTRMSDFFIKKRSQRDEQTLCKMKYDLHLNFQKEEVFQFDKKQFERCIILFNSIKGKFPSSIYCHKWNSGGLSVSIKDKQNFVDFLFYFLCNINYYISRQTFIDYAKKHRIGVIGPFHYGSLKDLHHTITKYADHIVNVDGKKANFDSFSIEVINFGYFGQFIEFTGNFDNPTYLDVNRIYKLQDFYVVGTIPEHSCERMTKLVSKFEELPE